MLARDIGLFMGATLACLALVPVWLLATVRGTPLAWAPWVALGAYVLVTVVWGVHLARVRYDAAAGRFLPRSSVTTTRRGK